MFWIYFEILTKVNDLIQHNPFSFCIHAAFILRILSQGIELLNLVRGMIWPAVLKCLAEILPKEGQFLFLFLSSLRCQLGWYDQKMGSSLWSCPPGLAACFGDVWKEERATQKQWETAKPPTGCLWSSSVWNVSLAWEVALGSSTNALLFSQVIWTKSASCQSWLEKSGGQSFWPKQLQCIS